MNKMLDDSFFDNDASEVAKNLIGKVICRKIDDKFRYGRIIETEAYYINDKASHASLGYTYKRRALFMKPGTIYVYHSRGGDSLNVSCRGEGNAVLIKSAAAHIDNSKEILEVMASNNLIINHKNGEKRKRPFERLCSGQAILCRSLSISRNEWDCKNFCPGIFYIKDIGYIPDEILIKKRLGISEGRDEHLLLRYIDKNFIKYTTLGR